jgi:cyclopropane-fatty-acyl-phospholipid synthase
MPVAAAGIAAAPSSITFVAKFADGGREVFGPGEPAFEIQVSTPKRLNELLTGNAYSTAMAFVRGEFSMTGDLAAAIRYHRSSRGAHFWDSLRLGRAYLSRDGAEIWPRHRERTARNIRYHYDLPTEFYRQFLDSRLVYSCAYFRSPKDALDRAQLAKLDLICRKLDLREGETFLDVGCGWGALILYAAERYGAMATGCTLSRQQFEIASRLSEAHSAKCMLTPILRDYRDLAGRFHKIASVGMFEHVAGHDVNQFFAKLFSLLPPGGLLLNHAIMRPVYSQRSLETIFLRRKVFPGTHLSSLAEVIRSAEGVGFEVLDVENLRPHYALTLHAWLRNLQERAAECLRLVGEATYRTWLIAFAASEANFADGYMNVHQVLLQKPGAPGSRRLTRSYAAGA